MKIVLRLILLTLIVFNTAKVCNTIYVLNSEDYAMKQKRSVYEDKTYWYTAPENPLDDEIASGFEPIDGDDPSNFQNKMRDLDKEKAYYNPIH